MAPTERVPALYVDAMNAPTIRASLGPCIRAGMAIRAMRTMHGDTWLPADTGIPDRVLRLFADTARLWPNADAVARYADVAGVEVLLDDSLYADAAALAEAVVSAGTAAKLADADPLRTVHQSFVLNAKWCILALRCERMRYQRTTQ